MRGPYRRRRVHLPPLYKNFKPSGVPRKTLESVLLSVDEYEAIRLADHLGTDHLAASEKMNISRPTFTRLIERARQKVARVLVEGLELVIEGGNVDISNTFYRCQTCGEEQLAPLKADLINCSECGSNEVKELDTLSSQKGGKHRGRR